MRVTRYAVIIWLTLLAIIFGELFFLRRNIQSDKLKILGFDTCDGDPCFLNVIPGVTSWADAHLLLQTHTGRENANNISLTLTSTIEASIVKYITPYIELVTVDDFTVFAPTEFPSAGEFLQKYGVPCLVFIIGGRGYIQLVYPSFLVYVAIDQPFNPYSRVGTVQILNVSRNLCMNEQSVAGSLMWSGFASVDRYFAHLRAKSQSAN